VELPSSPRAAHPSRLATTLTTSGAQPPPPNLFGSTWACVLSDVPLFLTSPPFPPLPSDAPLSCLTLQAHSQAGELTPAQPIHSQGTGARSVELFPLTSWSIP